MKKKDRRLIAVASGFNNKNLRSSESLKLLNCGFRNTNTFEINSENRSFKTILNKSNPNFILIDISLEKKFIDVNQIRDLITNLNKSSFNNKPRFVLIDNIEFLNINSVNALLKILEEPSLSLIHISEPTRPY